MSTKSPNQATISYEKMGIRKKVDCLVEYATEVYKVEYLQDEIRELKLLACESKQVPPLKVVDAIKKEWELWSPYLSPESFSNFMKVQIKKMIIRQAACTSGYDDLHSYVGKRATIICNPPAMFHSYITMKGSVFHNGVLVWDGD